MLPALSHDESGDSFVEYVILVGIFGLTVAGALIAVGFPLLRLYRYAQFVLTAPFA